ncbi:15173_t:CDS:2 [Dentiscutata heterogama]|uniref:15173_t:CDS:1 n=1 Tax=Dentiscutata heterogama TaxID=1316150 RepID=A0ACA9LYZ2_9GLOM|nr:15173_t:CDS:2 [Dentiscutata heterogama]
MDIIFAIFEETNTIDNDYSTLVIKLDDDEEDESKNKLKENTLQQLAKLKEVNARLKKNINKKNQKIKHISKENLLLKQENKRITTENLLFKQEIKFFCQQIVQKDKMYNNLQNEADQVQLNFQNAAVDLKKSKILNKAILQVLKNKISDCIDNKKRIADQQVLINYLEEQIEIVKSSNSNREKINVNLIGIIRKIKKEQSCVKKIMILNNIKKIICKKKKNFEL